MSLAGHQVAIFTGYCLWPLFTVVAHSNISGLTDVAASFVAMAMHLPVYLVAFGAGKWHSSQVLLLTSTVGDSSRLTTLTGRDSLLDTGIPSLSCWRSHNTCRRFHFHSHLIRLIHDYGPHLSKSTATYLVLSDKKVCTIDMAR